ncbi:hypothetical protein ES703_66760 [subsurface metagenome]
MLKYHRVPEYVMVVSQRTVEYTSLAKITHPTDGDVRVGRPYIVDVQVGFILHIETQQNTDFITRKWCSYSKNLIIYLKVFPIKCRGKRVLQVIDLDRPVPSFAPRMTIKYSAHHFRRFRPGMKIDCGAMDTR